MPTQQEFDSILEDASKAVHGDIEWVEDEDHSPSVEFHAEIESDSGWPIFVKGTYNAMVRTLSYAIIFQRSARIYALDLGKSHRNPSGEMVGEKHKHKWTEKYRDKQAYEPADITENHSNPVGVWKQFCTEAGITHHGKMKTPIERSLYCDE